MATVALFTIVFIVWLKRNAQSYPVLAKVLNLYQNKSVDNRVAALWPECFTVNSVAL